MVGTGPSYDYS